MKQLEFLKNKIMTGNEIGKDEALKLAKVPLKPLCEAADAIRQYFCGNLFDLCTIVNGKSGRCTENCKFCAQSAFYDTEVPVYPLMETDTLLNHARQNQEQGMPRYSIVTSGKNMTDKEIDQCCESIRKIRSETGLAVCASFGLLSQKQYEKLRKAGVDRVHDNLETSRRYFPEVCTTHSYEEKLFALQAAKKAGLEVCSGGIVGLGESMEDRIDMVLTIRQAGVRSIPVNLLNPIPGTPYEHNEKILPEELCRIVAIFRFLVPDGFIRLAGGRGLLPDKGECCFRSGANATISGDLLTTSGITIQTDLAMLKRLGFEIRR